MTAMPSKVKSLALRVTMVMSCTKAVAAIKASHSLLRSGTWRRAQAQALLWP